MAETPDDGLPHAGDDALLYGHDPAERIVALHRSKIASISTFAPGVYLVKVAIVVPTSWSPVVVPRRGPQPQPHPRTHGGEPFGASSRPPNRPCRDRSVGRSRKGTNPPPRGTRRLVDEGVD